MASTPTDPPTCSPNDPILFRLRHLATDFVIYMSNSMTDACPMFDKYEDQFFRMYDVPGKPGQVILFGTVARMVLYSRDTEPYVGKAGGGGIYEDNWFKLEPHATDKGKFRLLTPCNNLVVYVDTGHDLRLRNRSKDPVRETDYWGFLYDHDQVKGNASEV